MRTVVLSAWMVTTLTVLADVFIALHPTQYMMKKQNLVLTATHCIMVAYPVTKMVVPNANKTASLMKTAFAKPVHMCTVMVVQSAIAHTAHSAWLRIAVLLAPIFCMTKIQPVATPAALVRKHLARNALAVLCKCALAARVVMPLMKTSSAPLALNCLKAAAYAALTNAQNVLMIRL